MGKGLNQPTLLKYLSKYSKCNNLEGVNICLGLIDNDKISFNYFAKHGFIERLKILISRGVDINNIYDNKTALQEAAKAGQLKTVIFLISEGASQYIVDKKYYTPLGYAIKNNHPQIVEYLIKNGSYTAGDDVTKALHFLSSQAQRYSEHLEDANYILKSAETNHSLINTECELPNLKIYLEKQIRNVIKIQEMVYVAILVDSIILRKYGDTYSNNDFIEAKKLDDSCKELFVEIFENRCFMANLSNDADLSGYNNYFLIKLRTSTQVKTLLADSQFNRIEAATNNLGEVFSIFEELTRIESKIISILHEKVSEEPYYILCESVYLPEETKKYYDNNSRFKKPGAFTENLITNDKEQKLFIDKCKSNSKLLKAFLELGNIKFPSKEDQDRLNTLIHKIQNCAEEWYLVDIFTAPKHDYHNDKMLETKVKGDNSDNYDEDILMLNLLKI